MVKNNRGRVNAWGMMHAPLALRKSLKKFLPFFLIVVLAIALLEYRKSTPLAAPTLQLIPPGERSTAAQTEFALPTLSGETLRLSDLRGKVVILNFFATWCPPCRAEMPTLSNVFQTYQPKGVVVLGVAGDRDGAEVVKRFVTKQQLPFPVVLDPDQRVTDQYQVHGIPTIYLVDRQGRIAGKMVGAADWNSPVAHSLLDRLLAES